MATNKVKWESVIQVQELLKQVVPRNDGEVRKLEAVRGILPLIRELKDRGCGLDQITEAMATTDFKMTTPTLKRYMKQIDAEPKAKVAVVKTPKAPKQ
jgi:hypothetical protein